MFTKSINKSLDVQQTEKQQHIDVSVENNISNLFLISFIRQMSCWDKHRIFTEIGKKSNLLPGFPWICFMCAGKWESLSAE